jgi:hypothetical protein
VTDRIEELQRLHEAATKGPWRPQADDEHDIEADAGEVVGNYDWEEGGCIHRGDRDLIVAMRNALPALLRVARAAQQLRKAMTTPPKGYGDEHQGYWWTGDTEKAAEGVAEAIDQLGEP